MPDPVYFSWDKANPFGFGASNNREIGGTWPMAQKVTASENDASQRMALLDKTGCFRAGWFRYGKVSRQATSGRGIS